MGKLRGSGGWGGWQRFGGVQIWCSMLLLLCGFCSRTGGDVSIDSTIYVTVAVSEDWVTTMIPSHIDASSTSSPQEGSISPTTPLPQMSKISSQPVGSEDVITPSEILATAAFMVTEQYTSTLYDYPESSVSMEMSTQHQQSFQISSTAEGPISAATPGDTWATSTAAITEQETTTLYRNPDDTVSVDMPVASEQIFLSVSSDNPLTRSDATFARTLQPSSVFISQRTDFVTEWSDMRETLVSTVLYNSLGSRQTNFPESARTILPSRTMTVVPSTLFPSLPVSLQSTTVYMSDADTFSEGYTATPPLIDETLIATSEIVVTFLSTPLEVSETSSLDQIRRSTSYQPQSAIQVVSSHPSASLESDITATSMELHLSSLIYFTETSDFLYHDVTTQMPSIGLTNLESTLLLPSTKESTSPKSLPVESTIIFSSVVYVTESTEILQPSTQLFNPSTAPILSPSLLSQTENTLNYSDNPSYIFQTESMAFVETSEITSTATSDAAPSRLLLMTSVPTVLFPSIESSSITSVIFESITSAIFPTIPFGLTPGLTSSEESVGSEISTIFEEITTTEIMTDIEMITSIDDVMTSFMIDNSVLSTLVLEPTFLMTPVNTVPRSDSSPLSSSKWDSDVLWITSEVVETLVVSSDTPMVSETLSYSRGLSDASISTSFAEVTSRGVLDTLSLYETMTVESILPIPSILPSTVTFRPESQPQSTFVTSDPNLPSISTSMPEELYSTVVEIITSGIAGTDDLLRSTKAVDSPLPRSPTSVQSFFDSSSLQSVVYETLTIKTEVIYSTLVQSLLPSPDSTVQPEVSTPSPPSCTCIPLPTCTCVSPPPSLPPNLCSKIDCGPSVRTPASTLSLDYTTQDDSFIFETVTITNDVILYPTPDISEIPPTSDVTPLISPQSSYDLSTMFSENQVLPSQTISLPIISPTLQPEATVVPSPYYSSDSNVQSIVFSKTESLETLFYTSYFVETSEILYPSSESMQASSGSEFTYPTRTPEFTLPKTSSDQTPLPETVFSNVYETQTSQIFSSYAATLELSQSLTYSESSKYTDVSDASLLLSTTTTSTGVLWTDIYEIITTEVFEYISTDLYDSGTPWTSTNGYQVSTLFPKLTTPSLQTESTPQWKMSEEILSFSSIVMETSVLPIYTSVVSYEMSTMFSTSGETSTVTPITPSMRTAHPTASDGQVTTGSTTLFSESTATSLDSVTTSLFFSTAVYFSTILVSDTIIEPTASDGLVATGSTALFSESVVTSLYSAIPSLFYSTLIDVSTILFSDTIIEPTASDGLVTTGSTALFSESAVTSLYSVTPSLFYSTLIDVSTILVSDTIIEPTASDGLVATGSTALFSESAATSLYSVTPSLFYSTLMDVSTILVSDTIIEPTASDGLVTTGSTALFSESVVTSLYSATPSLLYSTLIDVSTILVSDTIIEPTASDGLVATGSTALFSESVVTSLYSATPSFLYSTLIDVSTILVSDTIIESTASDGLVATGSTALFSESVVTSLYSATPSLLYSTLIDVSTILVSDTIIEPTASDGLVATGSTALFSESVVTSLYSATPSLLYSTLIDVSTILVSDTIIEPTASDGLVATGSTALFSESVVTSLYSATPSLLYSTLIDVSTILVSDTIIEPTASDGLVATGSTALFSESAAASLYSVTPSLFYSTLIDVSTILVGDTIIEPTASDGLVTTGSTALFSESAATSLYTVTLSLFYSTLIDVSTILVSDTIIEPTASDGLVTTGSTALFSESAATSFDSVTPSLFYSTAVDFSTILISDSITDVTSILPTTLEQSSMLPSLPTFTPMLPSYTQTPGLDISSAMMYTTLELESPFTSESPQGLSSIVTEVSTIYDSVSPLPSLNMPSDDLTETLLTSEMVTLDPTSIFPTAISSPWEYLTLAMPSSDSFEPSSHKGTFGTVSTILAESSTSIPLLTPTESRQMSSLDTFIYTTMLDTVITNTLITLSTSTLEYSSSDLATSLVHIPSSGMSDVSTLEFYDTVSTSYFTRSFEPSFTTIDFVTSNFDTTPNRPTVEVATSIMSTVETTSRNISTRVPVLSSLDSYSTLILPPNYSSRMSGSYETVIPVQTTDYVISTMMDPTTVTSVSETRVVVTDDVTSNVVSSTFTLIEPSDVVSQGVTETASFYSQVVSPAFPTSTFLFLSPSDSLKSESSSFLVSETPPLTSMPLFTTVSLSQAVGSTSAVLSELPPTFTVPFSVSDVLLSSSVASQGSSTMILPSASQMVITSIPATLTPVTSTVELPIEVPQESQLTMDIKVPTPEDITAAEFSETLSNNLEILYVEAENNILLRRRRSTSEADTPPIDRLSQEWIFTRKQQADESSRARQDIELQDHYILNDEPRVDGLTMDSSAKLEWMFVSKQIGRTSPQTGEGTESKYRRKRQTDPSDEVEVPILMLSRADDTDLETVTMTFYVMENYSLVLATDAAATYNTLTEAEMSAQLGYAVRNMPHPVIPNPTTTPDYPYTIPPADQADWLNVTLTVNAAIDETNATFQKQLRNDLEFLYINGSDGLESRIARTRRDAERGDAEDGLMSGNVLIRGRRAADPSSSTEVALESVERSQADADHVNVVFYVVDEGLVIPGDNALVPYQQYDLQELHDVIGYQVVYPGVYLYLPPPSTGLTWWWWLIIAIILLLFLLIIVIFFYYFCWAKKTAVKSLNKVDRSTSVELGFLRLEKEPKAKLVVMETTLNEKASKRRTINGTREAYQRERVPEDAVLKRKKKKGSKRAQESAREYAKRGYLSDEDEQLFSHVDTHAARKPKTNKPVSTSRFQNAVYPEAERLPPLKNRSLVAYSETESEISNEQIRMMRKAGAPKSWYTTHIDKDPEELRKDIAKEKRRQKRKKEKKLHDQLTAEQMQKEFDAVLGGTDEQGIRNPTARQLQFNRTDRWKPKGTKRESEIPESAGTVNESAVRLIRTRPLESAAPLVSDHEAIKKEIEELLKRGPPKPIQGPLPTTSMSQDQAKELAEKKDREVRLRRKWADERKKINRILDEAFELSSTTFSNPSDQTNEDIPTTSKSSTRAGAFNKDLEDSGYLRHRGYSGYGALDDSVLPGMMPGTLAMPPRSIPLYETRLGLDLSGEHLYDSIRRPPIEYEFLPSQMRSDGSAPAYGVSVSPARTRRARVTPYPARDYMATDPYRSLNSSLSSSLQPMQITPRTHMNGIEGMSQANGNNDEEQDIIHVQEENMSLQRLVAKQQRELDHALALIGQPNSRIGQSEKSSSKEGKIGSNGRKQRRIVPVNSSKPLSGPNTVSAWTDDHKAVERTSHPPTSTPNKEHLIKVKPRPSQREGSVILEHHIEKPGKGYTTSKV